MTGRFKQRIGDAGSVFGTWCMIPSSTVVDVVAQTGLDFVVIDMEHGGMSWETAEDMVRAAQVNECQPIIRVGNSEPSEILHALETGCEAVMIPHIENVVTARDAVAASRYQPLGSRGLSPYTRCHSYTNVALSPSISRHAEDTFVAVLVEGREGLANFNEIAQVDGLDLIYLGLYDISQALGVPGQVDHPQVEEHLRQCVKACQDSGKLLGTIASDFESAKHFQQLGINFIAYVADSFALGTFFRDFHRRVSR